MSHRLPSTLHLPAPLPLLISPLLPRMNSTLSASTKEAAYPFNKPNATAILSSKDNVSFRVQMAILAEASPLFADMFALPQVHGGALEKATSDEVTSALAEDIPSIDVTEDSVTLDKILRFCYPATSPPSIDTLEELRPVLEAATKYQLDPAVASIRSCLTKLAIQAPVRVFVIASIYELEDIARTAAQNALRHPSLGKKVPELDLVPASVYHNLLEYHARCQRIASALASEYSWVPQGTPVGSTDFRVARPVEITWDAGRQPAWLHCTSCRSGALPLLVGQQTYNPGPAKWWATFMERTRDALKKRPCGDSPTAGSTGPGVPVGSGVPQLSPIHSFERIQVLCAVFRAVGG